jgi:hypothetical protein
LTAFRTGSRRIALLAFLGASGGLAASAKELRWFPDRPVAWFEHDDAPVASAPEETHLQELDTTLIIRDGLANEIDRALALEGRTPAQDVNAADEVPCSTWFCARNHLHPMTPEEVVAGPAAVAPVLPFKIVKGKDEGASTGFQVADATGRKFMLKVDPAGHLGMATGGELVGYRIFHAAGYNVPGAFHTDLRPQDFTLDPRATYKLRRVQKRPLTWEKVNLQLAGVARLPDGRIRAVAIPWMPGQLLGGFDMLGRRADDPNDRIPHQHRRSLRANWILFAWLSVLDPSSVNTMDAYVEEGGRKFVRHYHFDFGCAFGSGTSHVQSPHQEGEYPIEVGRTLRAFVSLGLYHRSFQDQRPEWERLVAQYPAIGFLPAEDFDPDAYRTNYKLPTHIRMTDRDAYWGTKVVTSFTDAQIDALVAVADLPSGDAHYVDHALKVRRDILGRRYLRAMAAVESPALSDDGARVCFQDLSIARGYAQPWEIRYKIDVTDGHGARLFEGEQMSSGSTTCVPVGGAGPGSGYRIVSVTTRLGGGAGAPQKSTTKASRIHLRWRAGEGRFVVVGLERDE